MLTGWSGGKAQLWAIASGQAIRAFNGHSAAITSVAFRPNGGQVLTGSKDKTARLWDLATGRQILAFAGHRSDVTSVAFSADGGRILIGSADKRARLLDITDTPAGSVFDIACAWLGDPSLSGVGGGYGVDLSQEEPICQKDATGKVAMPLPALR